MKELLSHISSDKRWKQVQAETETIIKRQMEGTL